MVDRLRAYIRSLNRAELDDYARRCGTSAGYLRKAIYTHPRFDGALCRLLDEESGGAVPRESLRPDIWPPDEAGEIRRPRKKSRHVQN